jgi:hypothetical protein
MRRWAFSLSLLAALSGTPLRQAEAASDLSRSLAKLFGAAEIECTDGGVGDDSGVSTLAASHDLAGGFPAAPDLCFLPPPTTTVATPAAEEGFRERVWWPQAPLRQRHAWLQVFRF